MGHKMILRRALEIGISLACLYLALRTVHPRDLWQALRQANALGLAAFVVLMLIVLALKAWRWQLLFYPEYRVPFGPIASILCVSYMVSNVLPGRVGELARVVLLPAEQPVSAARTVSSIIVERLLDLLCVLLLLLCLLPFVRLPAGIARGAAAVGLLAVAAVVALVVLSLAKERLLAWARLILRHVRPLDRPQVYAGLAHLIDGFALLRGPLGLPIMALALLSWAGVVGLAWTIAWAFHLAVPLTAVMFAVALTSLSMVLPSTPGYIGVFQYAVTLALMPWHVAPDQVAAYALAWWGMNYLVLTATGMVAMWVHGISFAQVRGRTQPHGRTAEVIAPLDASDAR